MAQALRCCERGERVTPPGDSLIPMGSIWRSQGGTRWQVEMLSKTHVGLRQVANDVDATMEVRRRALLTRWTQEAAE